MGKFYEFFHMDAATGVNELGLLYMKVRYWNHFCQCSVLVTVCALFENCEYIVVLCDLLLMNLFAGRLCSRRVSRDCIWTICKYLDRERLQSSTY